MRSFYAQGITIDVSVFTQSSATSERKLLTASFCANGRLVRPSKPRILGATKALAPSLVLSGAARSQCAGELYEPPALPLMVVGQMILFF